MSSDNSNSSTNKPPSPQPADMSNRRGSVSSTFQQLFARSNSVAGTGGTPVFPSAITTAALQEQQRRRLSLSTTTTLGMSGTSPTNASNLARRASMSTNSDFDENAIDEEDSPSAPRTAPVTPFNRRVSFGAAAAMRSRPGGTSPGTGNGRPTALFPDNVATASSEQRRSTVAVLPTPSHSANPAASASATSWEAITSTAQKQPSQPANTVSSVAAPRTRPRATSDVFSAPRTDQGFNWSEQLRSRAESIATGSRPSVSFASGMTGSPPRPGMPSPGSHDRARSVSEMPAPPAQAPKPRSPPRDTRPKPDHFQERILKGDFYMD